MSDIERVMYAPSVEDVWEHLTQEVAKLGFRYVHYTLNRRISAELLRMPPEQVILSNLSKPLIDQFLIGDFSRTAPLTRWLQQNCGVNSWDWVYDQWQQGLLSQPEERALRAFLEAGHLAGWGISLRGIAPRLGGAIVFGGELGMTQPQLDRIWNKHQRQVTALAGLAHMRMASLPSQLAGEMLTQRQREVLEWISAGKSNAEIAEILAISLPTVEKHLRLARQALGVKTTAQAIILATLRHQIFIVEPQIKRENLLADVA
ncbi:autoinducer binding domain-containing protein [Paracoccus sp. (in: a-proteobacteria)]|uniref:helix-turn-helix transcriptional regulator n=1 Tax=Paracoccus sp. TaxID=267 RepID=UPI00289DF8E3|nr:autoinducer binding domain-containing protein [Paracoccus sp. (in: a-proteobacteria)]